MSRYSLPGTTLPLTHSLTSLVILPALMYSGGIPISLDFTRTFLSSASIVASFGVFEIDSWRPRTGFEEVSARRDGRNLRPPPPRSRLPPREELRSRRRGRDRGHFGRICEEDGEEPGAIPRGAGEETRRPPQRTLPGEEMNHRQALRLLRAGDRLP